MGSRASKWNVPPQRRDRTRWIPWKAPRKTKHPSTNLTAKLTKVCWSEAFQPDKHYQHEPLKLQICLAQTKMPNGQFLWPVSQVVPHQSKWTQMRAWRGRWANLADDNMVVRIPSCSFEFPFLHCSWIMLDLIRWGAQEAERMHPHFLSCAHSQSQHLIKTNNWNSLPSSMHLPAVNALTICLLHAS